MFPIPLTNQHSNTFAAGNPHRLTKRDTRTPVPRGSTEIIQLKRVPVQISFGCHVSENAPPPLCQTMEHIRNPETTDEGTLLSLTVSVTTQIGFWTDSLQEADVKGTITDPIRCPQPQGKIKGFRGRKVLFFMPLKTLTAFTKNKWS